jgi:hypothetical protein
VRHSKGHQLQTLPEAYVHHRTAGRLRVRVPSRKGDAEYFSAVGDRFADCEGVERIEVNPATGSVLLIHHTDGESLAEYARAHELFDTKEEEHSPTDFHRQLGERLSGLNNGLKGLTGSGTDLWDLTFIGLLGAGAFQIISGNMTAIPWYSAFWYALGVYSKSKDGGG